MKRLLALLVLAFLAPISSGQTVSVTHDPWTGTIHARYSWTECNVDWTAEMRSPWDTRAEDTLHFRGLLYSTLRWSGDICGGYTSGEPGQGETVGTLPWIPGSLPPDVIERSPWLRAEWWTDIDGDGPTPPIKIEVVTGRRGTEAFSAQAYRFRQSVLAATEEFPPTDPPQGS